jgi:hypothetical protein
MVLWISIVEHKGKVVLIKGSEEKVAPVSQASTCISSLGVIQYIYGRKKGNMVLLKIMRR